MLNVALPKGRLGDNVYKLFSSVDLVEDEAIKESRKLVIEKGGFNFFLVKPSDVAIYVEHGVADIGIVGKDTLLDTEPDVYELLDLNMGKCKMAVAAVNGFAEKPEKPLRVATKYTNVARNYFSSRNREIELIKLNGSIELAPILGLSDVIVDIVETGSTLKENNLHVIKEITDISARLIANKSSCKFKKAEIDNLKNKLIKVI